MIARTVVAFISVFSLIWMSVVIFQNLSNSEKWALTKTLFFCTICSVLAVAALTIFVILF